MDYISIWLEIAIGSMGARCVFGLIGGFATWASLENLTPCGINGHDPMFGKPLRERFRVNWEPLSLLDNRALACRVAGARARIACR